MHFLMSFLRCSFHTIPSTALESRFNFGRAFLRFNPGSSITKNQVFGCLEKWGKLLNSLSRYRGCTWGKWIPRICLDRASSGSLIKRDLGRLAAEPRGASSGGG